MYITFCIDFCYACLTSHYSPNVLEEPLTVLSVFNSFTIRANRYMELQIKTATKW